MLEEVFPPRKFGAWQTWLFQQSKQLHLALSVDILLKVNIFPLSSVFETHIVWSMTLLQNQQRLPAS